MKSKEKYLQKLEKSRFYSKIPEKYFLMWPNCGKNPQCHVTLLKIGLSFEVALQDANSKDKTKIKDLHWQKPGTVDNFFESP